MAPRVYYPRAMVTLRCLLDGQDAAPNTFVNFAAVPVSVEIERNNAREADAATVELDYRDYPIDPRMVKEAQLTVHLGGVADALSELTDDASTRRFIGLVDEPETELGSESQVVRLRARDFTALWLDSRWPSPNVDPKIGTGPGVTLGDLVRDLQSKVVPNAPHDVLFIDPPTAALPVYKRTGSRVWTPANDDSNCWDILSGICDAFALVPVFHLDQLVIRTATSAGEQLRRRMLYGQNVDSLRFKRSMKRPRDKQVRVTAWNPVLGEVLTSVFPKEPIVEQTKRKPAADGAEEEAPKKAKQLQYSVEGAYDQPMLDELAKRMFGEIAQEQLTGELETFDMTDLDDEDLLGLQEGDLLEVSIGTEDLASVASMSRPEAVAFLSDPARANAIDPDVAEQLMVAWENAQERGSTFYVTGVTHRWNRENYHLSIGFRDFVAGV